MADALKHFFSPKLVRELAEEFRAAHASFDDAGFVRLATRGLASRELAARAEHIAEALRVHLPAHFPAAAKVLHRALKAGDAAPRTSNMHGFRFMPHAVFVARFGLDHFEVAMALQYEITQRFTAEFSVREFLVAHPERTLAELRRWAKDPSEHVRRLVSEGTRPRLPWARRLPAFQRDPAPVLALLELLKDDPARYVQRSVANNLNDIGKDHPAVLLELAARWMKEKPKARGADRAYIVTHALRSLVKAGNPRALAILGYGEAPAVKVSRARFEAREVPMGGKQRFTFEVSLLGKPARAGARETALLVDYVVHYVKAHGGTAPKVFKGTKVRLAPGEGTMCRGLVRLTPMTTRKIYPGVHRVEALVNGARFPLGSFRVTASTRKER